MRQRICYNGIYLWKGGVCLNHTQRIGVFDSGLGGISVLKTIHEVMPSENLVYYGDSLNAPYGIKSKEAVFELSKAICDYFIELECKAIVIACNTATSAAITRLRALYDIPIIGMEPAVKPAFMHTEGQVAVLATEMTLKEEKFNQLIKQLGVEERILKCPAPEWVTCVENHFSDYEYVQKCVDSFLQEKLKNAKTLVLGCTHFIFLKPFIHAYYQGEVKMFDGNLGTAVHLKHALESKGMLNMASGQTGHITIYNSLSEAYVEKSYALLGEDQ